MALEALANAIAQAGRDYSNYKREDDTHARDRAEKLADEQRAQDYQKKWFEYSNEKSLEYEARKFKAQSAAQREEEARAYGVNPDGLSIDQLTNAVIEAKRKIQAGDISSQRKAEVAAKGETFGDEQALQDKSDIDKVAAVWANYRDLQNKKELMDKEAQAAGVPLPDTNVLSAQVAEKNIRAAMGDTEQLRQKFFKDHGLGTAELQKAWQSKPIVERARDIGLYTSEDEKEVQRNANNQMSSSMRAAGYDVEGYQRRLAALEESATRLGINLGSNWEDLPIVQRTHAPNPIKSAPSGTGTSSDSAAAAAAAQKEYEEEAAKHVTPVNVVHPPKDSDGYGGLAGWWNNTQWRPGIVNALKSPLTTVVRPLEYMAGGQKYADEMAAARDASMQKVASWFTPISDDEAYKQNLEASYGKTWPDMSEPSTPPTPPPVPMKNATWANNYYSKLNPQPTPFAPKPATGLRDTSGWSNRYFSNQLSP